MSGLYGAVNVADAQAFLNRAAESLRHYPWYAVDTWVSPDGQHGLGKVGIGIFNADPQPCVSADGERVLFFCGELYNSAELARELAVSRDSSPEALALAAFDKWDTACAGRLEGPFFMAVCDRLRQRLVLCNDRFGLYPHYYCVDQGRLVFAPEVKGVLAAPFVRRALNLTAVAEYMRFQHLLGVKTFHEGVLQFPNGSVGTFDLRSGTWSLTPYWDWGHIPDNAHVNFDEAVEEAGRLMEAAVVRLASDALRPGVFLSGGLDSRAIIGLLPRRDPPPVSATFGARESRDVVYAGQIAAAVGSRHKWFDLPEDGSWVSQYLDAHFALTEGFHSWIHMHGMSMLPTLRGLIDYNLSGWDGGTLMGDTDLVNATFNQPANFSALLTASFEEFNRAYTWPGLTEAEERLLYQPGIAKVMNGLAFESFRDEFTPFWNFRHEYAHEFFYLATHCLRLTGNMITFARSHIEARFPFWDYSLVDFVYSLRPHIRREKLMYRQILTQRTPRLARIPYDKKEFLPTVNPWEHRVHALSVRARRRLHMFPNRPTLYADYENYLRRSLRPWAESILHSPDVAAHGVFDPAYVRDLLERHMTGRELWTIGRVAPIITLEMVLRDLFD